MRTELNHLRSILLGLFVAASVPASGQQTPTNTPDSTGALNGQHMMNDVVVTGQYAPGSTARAVQKIRVIDRKKIDAMSAQNLRDVLTNEMNIRLSQDNILGSSLTLQGVSGENVKILVDGVPVIGRQDGNIDLTQLNLNNIERIEIIEGPMSVTYGTNAIAGTINLISRKPTTKHLDAAATTYYESIGTYNVSFRAGAQKKKHALTVNGGRNYFDGWDNGEPVSVNFKPHIADSTRFRQWKPREQYQGGIQYRYDAGKTVLNYKASAFHEQITNRGIPLAPYGETAFDDYYYTVRTDNAFFVNSNLPRNKKLNFQAAYNTYKRTKNTWYNDLTTLGRTLSQNSGDQDTTRFNNISSRATLSTDKAQAKVNYELGYDINIEQAKGARIKNQQQQIGDYALFVSAEYRPVQQITIRPGIRYSYNTAYGAPLTPSIHARYKVNDALTIRGSYARGFRAPSLKELYFFFVDINHDIKGNDGLKAEHSDNYSLSAIYTHGNSHLNYKLEGSAYYNNIQDLITLALVSGSAYSYVNIGNYKTQGIQAGAELGIKNFKCAAGATYTGTYNMLSETNNVAPFSYSPEFRLNLFYEIKKSRTTIAAFFKHTGRMQGFTVDQANNVQQTFMAAYNTADVTVSRLFFEKRLNVSIGSKNIFDVKNITSTVSGGAHNAQSTSIPLNCGRLYFIKADLNLASKR